MDFALKVILSFLIGGGYVLAVVLFSERVGSRIGATIAGLPSTILIGIIFIILTSGSAAGRTALAIVPLMFSATLLYALVFIVITAKLTGRKRLISGVLIATFVWLVFSLAIRQMASLPFWTIASLGTLSLIAFSIGLRKFRSVDTNRVKLPKSTHLLRFLIGGAIIATSVLAAKFLSPTWGGIVASFPAMLGVILYFLDKTQGNLFLRGFIQSLPVGYVSSLLFIVVTYILLATVRPVISIALGMLAAVIYTYTLASSKLRLQK
jgi:hypothetical protein